MFLTGPFVRPSVRPSVREHDTDDSLKTSEPILLQIGTIGPRGKEMKQSTLAVSRSKVKVTRR